MVSVQAKEGTPHLFSGLIASGLVAAASFAVRMLALHLEHTTTRSAAPELFVLKKQGLALQRAAANAPNVLPLYGSSELTAVPVPDRAQVFFRTAPTGFQVSPIGAGGANSLSMLQKVAALGPDLRGKKVAISLSPGWFLKPTGQVVGRVQRKLFTDGSERNDIRDRSRFRSEARCRFTHAEVTQHARKQPVR